MSTVTERSITPNSEIPEGLVDVDSHEMIPLHLWPEVFGEAAETFTKMCSDLSLVSDLGENTLDRRDISSDSEDITDDSIWTVKGPGAPSAIDLGRRVEVLNVMGVDRQLIFPTFALSGLILAYNKRADTIFGFDSTTVDRVALSRQVIGAHNDWVVRTANGLDGVRLRPVAVILPESVDSMIADAERLIDAGVRGIMIPAGIPPAGMSPADSRLDPFWGLLASSNVPVLLHLGTEFSLLESTKWSARVPEFAPSLNSSIEFNMEPYWGSTVNFSHENFLTPMVLGGVFERHPMLRFGSIEVTGQWIGPFSERLDMWAGQFAKRLVGSLSMRPSEYINRNVRVTPFVFEDVALYLDRYNNLSDVYCFSSDYPHVEGGKDAKNRFSEQLAQFDAKTRRKFFVENGAWLMPDL